MPDPTPADRTAAIAAARKAIAEARDLRLKLAGIPRWARRPLRWWIGIGERMARRGERDARCYD